MTDVIEGTGTELDTEMVPAEPQPLAPPSTLFRTNDPVEVLKKASEAADALKDAIKKAGLTSQIQGKEYVRVEGWQTLGQMLGVTAVCEWTHEVEGGWEARVLARTLDGRTIGAAEAQCTKSEGSWKERDPFALRSMAQTRATAKALRSVLGFVVTLAGYEATPAEEMTQVAHEAQGGQKPTEKFHGPAPQDKRISEGKKKYAHVCKREHHLTNIEWGILLHTFGITDPDQLHWTRWDEFKAMAERKVPLPDPEAVSDVPADDADLKADADRAHADDAQVPFS